MYVQGEYISVMSVLYCEFLIVIKHIVLNKEITIIVNCLEGCFDIACIYKMIMFELMSNSRICDKSFQDLSIRYGLYQLRRSLIYCESIKPRRNTVYVCSFKWMILLFYGRICTVCAVLYSILKNDIFNEHNGNNHSVFINTQKQVIFLDSVVKYCREQQ